MELSCRGGLKPAFSLALGAALKRRSSTVGPVFEVLFI
jgi:hypothetical protein